MTMIKEDIIKNIKNETNLCVQKIKEISSDNIEQIRKIKLALNKFSQTFNYII